MNESLEWHGFRVGDIIIFENRYIGEILEIRKTWIDFKWIMGRGTLPANIYPISGMSYTSLNSLSVKIATDEDQVIMRMSLA
ncbi:MAG: hypothetical protein WC554_06120 [Clostridia bacterium]